MKTKDLIKLLEGNGWKFKRNGADHDVYIKGTERESVPRHKEIKENLVQRFVINRTLFLPESSSASLFFLDVATATPAKKRLAYEGFILQI